MNESKMSRYLLIWLSTEAISARSVFPIRREIEDKVKEPRDDVEIDVWLESPGGDAHSAFKLALMLRAAAIHVRVVVPDFAKSAATLLALAGHEIYLAPGAELGPLDAQLPEEGSLSGVISALNIARAADEVARDAVDLATRGTADVYQLTGLTRAQTLDAMLRFSGSFSEPLVRQLDPRTVHHAKQMLRVTQQYAERLLTDTVQGKRPEQIASKLVEDFPTHGFVICFDEARKLGVSVQVPRSGGPPPGAPELARWWCGEGLMPGASGRVERVEAGGRGRPVFHRRTEGVGGLAGGADHGPSPGQRAASGAGGRAGAPTGAELGELRQAAVS